MAGRGRRAAFGLAWVACLACATSDWDAAAWARTRPELADVTVGALGQATPYVLAADGALDFFLCRWSLATPLRTALPDDASGEERALLGRVLAAWEAAVPGLAFEVVEADAPLRFRFGGDEAEHAHSAVHCRVTPRFERAEGLAAELVAAEIVLRRSEGDAWGRPRALSSAELMGAAAHELGHALGLQGHVRGSASALRREPGAVRRLGERLLAGEPLVEEAARALYAVPSGARVARRTLAPGATAGVDAIARRARAGGAEQVDLRLGDRAQRVAWGRDPGFVYYVRKPAELLDAPERFESLLVLPPGASPIPGR